MSVKRLARGFAAGFLATLIFHQITLAVLGAMLGVPIPLWDMHATPPLGVPAVISLAFWGGIWGIALAWLEPRLPRAAAAYWALVVAFGAIGPTAVYILVVQPLKGAKVPPEMLPKLLVIGLAVNAAWGIGTVLFLKLADRLSAQPRSA